jgi:two-component system cell cycle sensor histidine kinase/response regulator CckA
MVMDIIRDDRIASEHLNEVLAAAEKAENLTKRLLLFGRKEVAEFKAVDVNGTVNNVAKILSRIIGEDIRLVMNLMRERALVMADAGQMEQVLMNLATNARDAMPEGGTLTIGTELRAIDDLFAGAYYDVPGTFVVISVTDTGTGIREEDKSRIFDPFFTTKPVDKGTGLGLSIAYGIIKQHSGYLKVYSEQGKGATFQIWLPLIEDAVEEKPAVQVLSLPKGGTETILVAEDDASMRKLTRIVLERYGYHVIMAEDGEDAVKKFAGNKEEIRLVMLDMIMPKKGGREAYEEIREMAPRTRTLFLSGYTAHEGSARELTAEGFDFIYKPVLPEDLLRKVREILDRP